CQEELYGIASLFWEEPYVTKEAYKVAEPAAGEINRYRYDNPKKQTNSVRYKNENLNIKGYRDNRNTARDFGESFPKTRKQNNKSRIEPRVLKNREPENQKLIDELNYDREESNKLISELRNNLAIKENELKEHRETASKLESKLSNVVTRLTDLEKFDIEHRLKIEENEVESMNLRMRIAEMDKLLAQKDEEKSSWLKITKDKDRKVTELMKSEAEKGELLEKLQSELKGKEIEMNRNLISTQNNIADLSKALTEMGESLEEWKRENKIKLNEVEVESMTWKMKSIEMDNVYASLIKIVKGKDEKLAEMKVNLIIANQNITGLNKT
ncbi:unnamed protein product, partial [Trichobilharzia regenti]